jgi:hypothetical protein
MPAANRDVRPLIYTVAPPAVDGTRTSNIPPSGSLVPSVTAAHVPQLPPPQRTPRGLIQRVLHDSQAHSQGSQQLRQVAAGRAVAAVAAQDPCVAGDEGAENRLRALAARGLHRHARQNSIAAAGGERSVHGASSGLPNSEEGSG